jgi:hypothetical protein
MKLVNEHDEVEAIQKRRWYLTHKEFRSLFGLANDYHHFIQDFSKVARTLSDLLEMAIPRVG